MLFVLNYRYVYKMSVRFNYKILKSRKMCDVYVIKIYRIAEINKL